MSFNLGIQHLKMFASFLKKLCVVLPILFCMLTQTSFALAQNEKLWMGVNTLQTLSNDKKWLALFFTQLRLIDKSHPWQSTLFEGGIGYRLQTENSVWVGYRWSANNPNNGFYADNRFFQQFIWDKKLPELYQLIIRSRIEEVARGRQSQIAVRLRERAAFEYGKAALFASLFPFIYNEVFFQLNNTNYTSSTFVSENRLFLGFNLRHTKKDWWEIGYINQYMMHTPISPQNQMNHIVSVNYNFL